MDLLNDMAPQPPEPSSGRVIDDPKEVVAWLKAELGLSLDAFDEATERARLEWATQTEFDPPGFPGTIFWGTCVRFIRWALSRERWRVDNSGGLSRCVHPSGVKAIVVETGDENTGVRGSEPPKTKSPKGPLLGAAITSNALQLDVFVDVVEEERRVVEQANMLTYILLVRISAGRVYRELSLPISRGDNRQIDSWNLRVILPSAEDGDETLFRAPAPEPAPEPTISITRRTA